MSLPLSRTFSACGAPRLPAVILLVLITSLGLRAVQAQVVDCTVTATSVAFGTYTPMQPTPLISTGTITTICRVSSKTNTITVALSAGNSGSFTTRTLTTTVGATTYSLNYNLYLDPTDTQIWGDGTGGSVDTVTLTRNGNGNGNGNSTITTNLTIYGAIMPAQDPAPGTYSDGINVTVNF